MISIKTVTIAGLPLLEIAPEATFSEKLPTVFFYHGWTNVKESSLVNGYELAKRGFRALLPEAHLHGERKTDESTNGNVDFWNVVVHNLSEINTIKEYYVEQQLTDPDRIGVSGLSMGGITTSAMLTQFPWIKAAGVLMGTPSPISFSKWILNSPWTEGLDIELTEEQINQMTDPLKAISLALQPEKIAGRPVYFWHGTKDELVPYSLTNEFIQTIQNESYAKNVQFETTVNGTHKVPYAISVEMADFFEENLK
ncbi:prolyl oligopeptidase family serine peptidase [Desemzia sp. FAM 23991]|uniref:prolyl oligopeptidase family serine peptidase n=1 Tax=unclassified Desemzia TaxID=2685243 RepID=UPI003885AEAD